MQELTSQEFEILIEAIDVWPNRRSASDLMGTLITHMISSGNDEMKKSLEEKEVEEKAEKERISKQENEISTVLKAKLIQLRDAALVKDIVEELNA